MLRQIAVVGGSLAGLRAVEALRRGGFDGRLIWIGAEEHLPYDRPPLSKEVLRGDWDVERTALRKKGYEDLELDFRFGHRAVALDPDLRKVELDDGESLTYDGLIIATGATPRELPGTAELGGVHVLRNLDQALELRRELDKSPRVLIVGAGFIGAEVAASCRARGLDVTMVEPLAAPMIRGLGREIGEHCGRMHRDQGVDLRCNVGVESLEGGGRVEAARLSDGSRIEADVVVVGIGVVPETDWLASSGLELLDGVVCDSTCATAAPGVVAAGDVARWMHPLFEEPLRLEHWTNAVEMGMAAAARLLAGEEAAEPFAPVPFVWTDQYDAKIQIAGRAQEGDESRLVRGSLEEGRFVILYGRDGQLVGVTTFNRPRDCMRYREMIGQRTSWEQALAYAAEQK